MGEVDTSTSGFFDSAERGRGRSLVRVRATFVHEWVFYVGVSMVHKSGGSVILLGVGLVQKCSSAFSYFGSLHVCASEKDR